jgi:hypothetical protein
MFNLAVNAVMPSIAYYSNAVQAMSLWKFVPLTIAIAGAIALTVRRRSRLEIGMALVFPLAMFFLPAVPTLIMSQSPDAWRVATPAAFALALSVLPVLLQFRRFGPLLAVLIAAVMIPPAVFESQERVKSTKRDEAIVQAIASHWQTLPTEQITIAYAGPKYGNVEEPRLIESRELTWGYKRFTPAIWSPFNNGWFAGHYIATYHGFRYMGCGERRNPVCSEALAACQRAGSDVAVMWPRVVHTPRAGLSAICVQ